MNTNSKIIELNNHIELLKNNIDIICNNLIDKTNINDNLEDITLIDLILCFSSNSMLPTYDTLVDINNNSYMNIPCIGTNEFINYFKNQLQIIKVLHDKDLLNYYKNNKITSDIIDKHYSSNRHHPEYFYKGIKGMNIIDITEMLCDWNAYNEDIFKTIDVNQKKYGYGKVFAKVLKNTVDKYF